MDIVALKKDRIDIPTLFIYAVLGWCAAAILGIVWAFCAKTWNLPKLFSAQSALGIFGFIGSFSHYFILGKLNQTWGHRKHIGLPLIWGVCFAGAVTPLFSVSGTPIKMAILAFSSFAVFGAVGGISTVLLSIRFFGGFPCNDKVAYGVVWALGLGTGAVSVYVSTALMKLIFSETAAMVLAIGAMALMLAISSGLSLTFCVPGSDYGRWFLKAHDAYDPSISKGVPGFSIFTTILLFIPFCLNDFSNIFISDWRWWLFIDYIFVRLFPFILIFRMLSLGRVSPETMGIGPQSILSFIIVYVVATLAAVLLFQNKSFIFSNVPGFRPLGAIPKIANEDWRWFDLTAGLFVSAVVEEMVFRAYLYSYLRRFFDRSSHIIFISALAFGVIHWSLGFHHVITTSIIGGIYMMLYIRTRSLPALVFAHYTVNFIEYSDIIDKFLFKFI